MIRMNMSKFMVSSKLLTISLVLSLATSGFADKKETSKQQKYDPANELGLTEKISYSGKYSPPQIAAPVRWGAPEKFSDDFNSKVVKYIPRLNYPRNGRWPILVWHMYTNDLAVIQAYIDRGISPLFNSGLKSLLPVFKHMQNQNVPVIFLWQGLVQRLYNRGKAHHQQPAKKDNYCLAMMMNHPQLNKEAAKCEKFFQFLKTGGIKVDAVFIDMESGVYLRNGKEIPDKVQKLMRNAAQCPACVKAFGKESFQALDKYRELCDRVRTRTIKTGFTDPLRKVFPNAFSGNFFAWPIDRYMNKAGVLNPADYDLPGGMFPAYGYTGSGMNVLQPRCYFVPGWQSWGMKETVTDQNIVNWNIFHYCIRRFSKAAKVKKPDEKLVPWVGWLFGVCKNPELKCASGEAYKEAMIHTLLRGAETIAVFSYHKQKFSPEENVDRKEMGAFLRNIVDVQAAYNEVLRFQPFINKAMPLNLEHNGTVNRPGIEWSGYGNDQASLIRTVSFGESLTASIYLYGREITFPFEKHGQWFWGFPDGKTMKIKENL